MEKLLEADEHEVPSLDTLNQRAWGEVAEPGLDERLGLYVFPLGKRDRAARRLLALLRWAEPGEEEPRFKDAAAAARFAGMHLTAFYAMVRRWKVERNVSVLGLHAVSRKPRQSRFDAAFRSKVVESARAHLEAEPSLSNQALVRKLGDELDPAPSRTTLLRLVEEARRSGPPLRPFGELLLFDSAGMDMVDHKGGRLRLGTCIDAGTGLILAWSLGVDEDVAGCYGRAARRAVDDPSEQMAYVRPDSYEAITARVLADAPIATGPMKTEVRLLPGDEAGCEALYRIGLADLRVVEDRQLGRAVIARLGDRLHFVWLGTGTRAEWQSYRTGRVVDMPTYDSSVDSWLEQTVRDHNQTRLGFLPRRTGSGSAEDALAAANGVLRALGGLAAG